jgi:hypothetical protein
MCTAALPAFAGQSGLRAALLARGGITATLSVIEARNSFAPCFALTPHLAYLTDWEAPGHAVSNTTIEATSVVGTPEQGRSRIEVYRRSSVTPILNAFARAVTPSQALML